MGFFDFLKSKKRKEDLQGSLSYIPGSQMPTQELPISFENGELVKRMYIQPELRQKAEHTSIAIYTENPFRRMMNPTMGDFQ